MCKIIYDNKKEEVKGMVWDGMYVYAKTNRPGRYIIANDNKLMGR